MPIADHEFVAVSIPRRMLPARSTLPEVPPLAPVRRGEGPGVRGRARRFAWPARGTERFLGRNVFKIPLREWRPCRRCMGTCSGLIPYSCWVPPRSIADEWTPLLEPSRRRHRRLRSVRNKTDANDYDAKNHSEVSPWKERSSPFRGQITVRPSQVVSRYSPYCYAAGLCRGSPSIFANFAAVVFASSPEP